MLVRGAVLTVVLLGLVAFSVLLAKVTLTPSPASEDLVTANLRPGRSLRQYAEDYTFLAACKQAGGNLLLGVPFGLLLPFFVPRRLRMIRTTLLTAVAMAVVELIQGALVEGRAFDIDDVILNTAGALLGYFVLGRRISHRYYAYTDDSGPSAEKPEAELKRARGQGQPCQDRSYGDRSYEGGPRQGRPCEDGSCQNPRYEGRPHEDRTTGPAEAGGHGPGQEARCPRQGGPMARRAAAGARPGPSAVRSLLDRLRGR